MAKKSACMDVQFCNSCNSGYPKAVKQTIAFSKGGLYQTYASFVIRVLLKMQRQPNLIRARFNAPICCGAAIYDAGCAMHLMVAYTQAYNTGDKRSPTKTRQPRIASPDGHTYAFLIGSVIWGVTERGYERIKRTNAHKHRSGSKQSPARHCRLVAAVELPICLRAGVFQKPAVGPFIHTPIIYNIEVSFAYHGRTGVFGKGCNVRRVLDVPNLSCRKHGQQGKEDDVE